MKTICLLLLLGTALAQIIPNCYVQNIVDKYCVACEVGWKKINGVCEICDDGYQMINSKCIPITTIYSQSTVNTQQQTNTSQSLPTNNNQSSNSSNVQNTTTQIVKNSSQSTIPNIVTQTIPGFVVIQNPCGGVGSDGKCLGCISGFTLTNGVCVLTSTLSSASQSPTTTQTITSTSTPSSASQSPTTTQTITSASTPSSASQSPTTTQTITSTSTLSSSILSTIMQSNPSVLPSSVSVVSSNGDPGCSEYDPQTGACKKCSTSYHQDPLVTTSLKCIQNDPLCKNYTSTYTCSQCFDGYIVINGVCIVFTVQTSQLSDPNCKNYTNGVCYGCYPGYYVNSSTNKCNVANPLCKQVNSDNTCQSCYGGFIRYLGQCIADNIFLAQNSNWKDFYLSIPGVVQSSAIGYQDPNCKNFTNGVCVECSVRSYLKNGICLQVDPNCNFYNNQTGACTTCYKGFAVVNGTCLVQVVNTVQSCPYRSVLINGVCVSVDGLCKDWNRVTALCTKCYLGYEQLNGVCIRTI